MHGIIAALWVASSCVAMAQAQDTIFTLEKAVAAAVGSAPAADAAQADIAAAQAARAVAALRPNPELQTQVENIAGSGPYGGFSQAETTVGLAIPVELGGKRSARMAATDGQTSRAQIAAALAQAEIRLQVTTLYVDAIAAERRVTTAREQVRIAQDALRAAQIRVQAGRASPIEAQRADVARLNAVAALERMERLANANRANLARRIGQPMTAPLDTALFDRLPRPVHGPTMATSTGTLALAAADADVGIADAEVRLARSQRIPDLNIGPAVRRLEASNAMAAVFTLTMPIPLFSAGRAAVTQAHVERTKVEAQRRMTALDVEQAITDAQAQADNAAITARMAGGPALAAAQESARIARIGYREGKFGQLDLLDAERTLADTRVAAINALATYHNARARLERLTTPAPEQGI